MSTDQPTTRYVCGTNETRVEHLPATILGGGDGYLIACCNEMCDHATEPYSTQMEAENAWEILQRQARRKRFRIVR